MKTPTDKQLKDRELKDQERDLNRKIALVSQEIKDNYPALIKWLDKKPVLRATDRTPEIKLRSLKSYYDSLNAVLNDYISEQS